MPGRLGAILGCRQLQGKIAQQVPVARRQLPTPAKEVIQPKALTWVIVAALSKVEAGVRALNLGSYQVIDANGQPVAPAAK